MPAFEIQDVMKMLPHRFPFLLVDRVLECDDVKHIVAIKNVTINEPFFQGHFVGNPIMPGVLQIEAMAQTGGILISRIHQKNSRLPYFMAIDDCRFRRIIRPGDQMRIEMNIIASKRLVVKLLGKVTVDGQLATEATLMCMVTEEMIGA